MERIKKENQLDPVAKLHIIYGSIIMFMSVAFIVTLVTMKNTYKGGNETMAQAPPMMQGDAAAMEQGAAMDPASAGQIKPGSGGMPPFVKKMVDDYKAAIEKNPKDTKALVGLANMYYDSGQYTKAIDYYEKMVEIEPNNSNVRADLGTCYFYTNVFDKAISHLKKSIESDPSNLNARYNLGIVYKNQNKIAEAKAEWEGMKPYVKTDEEKKKLDSVIENLGKTSS